MKRALTLLLLVACACCKLADEAIFTPFVYTDEGSETVPEGCYSNPILKGFYPDPSICRKGNDYYMVTSTFQYFPVIPVFHSTDLVHWEQCGSVLDSDAQISFTRKKMNLGNFAPGISYNPSDGKFYVACTQVGGGLGNWYCTSEDPASGKWEGPFVIKGVRGIDPEFFFDEDGRTWYLTCTSPEDAGSSRRYPGEFAIVMWEFDCQKREICSSPRIIARGGARPEEHPENLEGPHLFKVDGKYFLICAEGGTEHPDPERPAFRAGGDSDLHGACRYGSDSRREMVFGVSRMRTLRRGRVLQHRARDFLVAGRLDIGSAGNPGRWPGCSVEGEDG